MKITKEMGLAALRDLRFAAEMGSETSILPETADAYSAIFGNCVFNGGSRDPFTHNEALTALAMCAAIAGVKPEDVE